MSFFVGVDLGQVSEATAIVIVESDTLEQIRTVKIYEKDWITYQPIYRGRDGKETMEHPPISYALRHLERVSPGTAYPAIVERVSTAQILLQTSRLRIASGLSLSKLLVKELSTFRMKVGVKEEDPTFWREGAADDLVLGLSIALWLAERNGSGMGPIIVGRLEFGEAPPFSWGDGPML